MEYTNFNEEKKLWKKGFRFVAGCDEAGRGPLAGPVVAAAVFIKPNTKKQIPKMFNGIKDSKKLSEKQRENFYKILTNYPQIKWGIGMVSEKVIDKINILEATKLAIEKSVKKIGPDFLILDGNFKVNSKISQKSIIKADEKVFSCVAAGIIAKVTRDRIMKRYHKKYPKYGFDRHKGYPTKAHFTNLKKFGPCKVHRRTFYPVSANLSRSRT